MRIAVVGAGVSGLCVAYYLRAGHDVTVFEANDYAGGHTNTISVETEDQSLAVDTGFIVFNERTYPSFCKLLAELRVPSQPSDMSFSVRCDRSGLEYAGTGLNGLLAQRSNLLRPGFWRLVRDWRRFGQESQELLANRTESITVRDFFREHRYSREFREQYFLPIGSAIWSCPHDKLEEFPMRFIVDFYNHHGLLTLHDPPQWRVIRGGSKSYVQALLRRLSRPVQLNSQVRRVERTASGVSLHFADGSTQAFDHAVMASHADQSLRLLGENATPTEHKVLSAFPYEANTAVLHTDTSVLPRSRRAWASWNYRIPAASGEKATVTYNMNRLQGLRSDEVYCVSLNEEQQIDPRRVLRTIVYHHPVFSLSRVAAQRRHEELINHDGLSYCGAYWGNGFHEDGVNSALAVCRVLRGASQLSAAVLP
jgi:predicted NAD/FAD-binding protein